MRYQIIVLLCFIIATFQPAWSESKKICSEQDAMQAETEIDSLRNWEYIYKSYKRFAQCDDGSIAEGYSDVVARLLSDHWNTVGDLVRLGVHDRGFEQFVLRHVDELMSPTQAENIRRNALSHCVPNGNNLCRAIISRIKEASSSNSLP